MEPRKAEDIATAFRFFVADGIQAGAMLHGWSLKGINIDLNTCFQRLCLNALMEVLDHHERFI